MFIYWGGRKKRQELYQIFAVKFASHLDSENLEATESEKILDDS